MTIKGGERSWLHSGGVDEMLDRILPVLLLVAGLTGAAWAATDPFLGQWKINPSKSKLYDEMKVEQVEADRYALTFGPGQVDTVAADGSDQPALSGTTLSITVTGAKTWEVVRKMKGRVLLRAEWRLSEDGKTLNDAFTQYLPDAMTLLSQPLPNGSTLFLPYTYDRTEGNSGFAGTWDSESAKVRAGTLLKVETYEGGLSFKRSDEEKVMRIKLDAKDPDTVGTQGVEGSYSARRVNERSLEVTYKSRDTITSTRAIELSADLKSLTMTERLVDQSYPRSVLVFERE
jgi:hypothetical protein